MSRSKPHATIKQNFSLAQAMFLFGAPEHGQTIGESHALSADTSTIIEKLRTGLNRSEPPSRASLEAILKEESGAENTKIEGESCTFWFKFQDAALYSGSPWEIIEPLPSRHSLPNTPAVESLQTGFVTLPIEEGDQPKTQFRRVQRATSLVWNGYMRRSFDRAVAANRLGLLGRIGSATSGPEQLPADLWPLLEVVDWAHGLAVDPSGVAYWSVQATEADPDRPNPEKPDGRSTPAMTGAAKAVADLYPNGVPTQTELPNARLTRAVSEWLKLKTLPSVSDDTIFRAAGRRRK